MTDVVHGLILSDTICDGSRKKLAKRQVEMLEGNNSSYFRVLNSLQRLETMAEMNGVEILGEIRAENNEAKAAQAAATKEADTEKDLKKAERDAKEAEKTAQLLPELTLMVAATQQDESVIGTVNNARLKELLRYIFHHV